MSQEMTLQIVMSHEISRAIRALVLFRRRGPLGAKQTHPQPGVYTHFLSRIIDPRVEFGPSR